MKTNRSLLKLIVFSVLTFGIYALWFWSDYAQDMNTVCNDDGKTTRGILARLIFSILTFGIYDLVWMYAAGERIATNTQSKGIPCTTTGGNVLGWFILGALVVIGPFVALHKLINGLNVLCEAYNQNHQTVPAGAPTVVINNY